MFVNEDINKVKFFEVDRLINKREVNRDTKYLLR